VQRNSRYHCNTLASIVAIQGRFDPAFDALLGNATPVCNDAALHDGRRVTGGVDNMPSFAGAAHEPGRCRAKIPQQCGSALAAGAGGRDPSGIVDARSEGRFVSGAGQDVGADLAMRRPRRTRRSPPSEAGRNRRESTDPKSISSMRLVSEKSHSSPAAAPPCGQRSNWRGHDQVDVRSSLITQLAQRTAPTRQVRFGRKANMTRQSDWVVIVTSAAVQQI
jgi:hypothetical protein